MIDNIIILCARFEPYMVKNVDFCVCIYFQDDSFLCHHLDCKMKSFHVLCSLSLSSFLSLSLSLCLCCDFEIFDIKPNKNVSFYFPEKFIRIFSFPYLFLELKTVRNGHGTLSSRIKIIAFSLTQFL